MIELVNGETQAIELFKKTTETTDKTIDTEFETNINPEDFPEDFLKLQVDTNVMMQIVTGAMYENPLIPFQELTCNGRDAIIRKINSGFLGFSPKIDIVVDYTKLEASITDNGIGMTWKKVEDIYCYIGRSDKRDTKHEMGKWGVGAKTPFAMSSTYRVKSTSFENHKTIKFLVTSKGIMKEEEYDNPNEESGTTITFPISIEYRENPDKILKYLRERVDVWNLPVYYTAIHHHGTHGGTQIISRKYLDNPSIPTPLTIEHILKTSQCFYPYKLIKTNKGFSFAFETTKYNIDFPHSKMVFIEGILYPLKWSAPSQVCVVIEDLSLLNTSATRENLSYDTKYVDFIELLNSEITSYFTTRFGILFANPDFDNVPEITRYDLIWYSHLLSKGKIHPGDYPFYDILINTVDFYHSNSIVHASSRRLNQLSEFDKIFFTTPITLPRRKVYFQYYPNHALIKLSDLCLKDCTQCKNFVNSYPLNYDPLYLHDKPRSFSPRIQPNYHCAKKKEKSHPILKYYKHIPKLKRSKLNPQLNPIIKETFRAHNNYTNTSRNIHYKYIMDYIITKHDSDAPFSTVLKVTPKKFSELKDLGCTCFETENEVKDYYRKELVLQTNNKTFSLEELHHYDYIVNLRNYDQKSGPEKLHLLVKEHLSFNVLFVVNVINSSRFNYASGMKILSWDEFINVIPNNLNVKITYEQETTLFNYISMENPPLLNVKIVNP